MKKRYWILVIASLLVCIFAFSGCDLISQLPLPWDDIIKNDDTIINDTPNDETSKDNETPEDNETDTPTHYCTVVYISDDTYHWQQCLDCGKISNKSVHDYGHDNICRTCSYVKTEVSSYPWENTALIYQITENSNHREFPSTCRRYLAGDVTGVVDRGDVDAFISKRNQEALDETNVTVTYQYIPDTPVYCWGENIVTIAEEALSKRDGRPDMYCNFIYDMVAASLHGAFANLYSTTMYEDGHKLFGGEHNYFDFAIDPSMVDTGEGYMLEYMRSLTLSKYKMYCLASDYLIDLVRAEMVIPVNIALLESLLANTDPSVDRHRLDRVPTYDIDGTLLANYTIEDFYQLIYDGEWTYENLAKFSNDICHNRDDDEFLDLRDTVGFALPTGSGMPAYGLLYSTSLSIIEREYDPVKGEYTHSYTAVDTHEYSEGVSFSIDPMANIDELREFCTNLYDLFNSNGVISVSNGETFGFGSSIGGGPDITAIRERFASNNVLFGGIVTLGSLEYNEFKQSNAEHSSVGYEGYAIAPIPLYRSSYVENGETKVDSYNTQIYHLGKIVAISYTTENFAQCTAYLNYMSTNSTEILNEYYDHKHSVKGEDIGTVEMLKYIRNNVGSGLDATYDSIIARYCEVDDYTMWSSIIKDYNYQIKNIIVLEYKAYVRDKARGLYNLENLIYPSLPD